MVWSQKFIDRYRTLKAEVPDCLLLMQVGAFMQVMNDDARAVSQVTGLKLQMAGDVDAPVVLGGFPKSGLDAYIGRLVRAGHSVAVALQDGYKERRVEEVIRIQYDSQAPRKVGIAKQSEGWLRALNKKRGFFISLDRTLLYERLIARAPDPVVRWLIRVILVNEPAKHCRLRDARRAEFDRLPPHKTLFKAQQGGLHFSHDYGSFRIEKLT